MSPVLCAPSDLLFAQDPGITLAETPALKPTPDQERAFPHASQTGLIRMTDGGLLSPGSHHAESPPWGDLEDTSWSARAETFGDPARDGQLRACPRVGKLGHHRAPRLKSTETAQALEGTLGKRLQCREVQAHSQ